MKYWTEMMQSDTRQSLWSVLNNNGQIKISDRIHSFSFLLNTSAVIIKEHDPPLFDKYGNGCHQFPKCDIFFDYIDD